MKILVCGGRDYPDAFKVAQFLDDFVRNRRLALRDVTIIHGDAHGVDAMANVWAMVNFVNIERYPADWKTYGRAAGMRRNAEMLSLGQPDIVIAFPGGRGTAGMVRLARRAGVPVIEVR